MKIEIKSADVETRSGTARDSGKPFTKRTQTAYIHKDGEPYPERFQISLGDSQPYQPGFYTLSDRTFRVGRYGDLELDRFEFRLVPVVSAPAARSA